MPKITKTLVDKLELGGKTLWDAELKGFGIRPPRAAGGAKVFVLKKGKHWLTIGRYGSPWTVETARKEALRLLGELVAGRDPTAEKEAERLAGTVADLCALYLREGTATLKPATVRNHRSRIHAHVIPLLGDRRVRDVGRGDIERLQAAIADGCTALDRRTGPRGRSIVRGGKGAARLTVMMLSAIFSFAVARGLRRDNPCTGVRRFKPSSKERFLSAAEQVRLGEALSAALAGGANPTAIAAIRLLALSGMRRGEVLLLKWNEVDFERQCLRLGDSKTGAKVVQLGAAALDLLAGLAEAKAALVYVFPSAVARDHPISDINHVWQRVRRAAGLADVRLHDLRHSFASDLVNSGASLAMIGKLLGHRSVATTARYSHLSDDPLRAVADRAAGSIASALAGRPGADFAPLQKKA
jgi:integrase